MRFSSRMLKRPASFVLASFRPSTYPRGYASGPHSLRPCWTAFLSTLRAIGFPACHNNGFPNLLAPFPTGIVARLLHLN